MMENVLPLTLEFFVNQMTSPDYTYPCLVVYTAKFESEKLIRDVLFKVCFYNGVV